MALSCLLLWLQFERTSAQMSHCGPACVGGSTYSLLLLSLLFFESKKWQNRVSKNLTFGFVSRLGRDTFVSSSVDMSLLVRSVVACLGIVVGTH